ncbi:AraC family transcriptional regulator [Dysgonomonas sp. Marseille-P4677]|uniref:helix-turn-helix transcriptional regulator n=1 Tax=Dysgonomonas sp. Marseille-P4677 TaxID=2364790 RepID=UPI001911A77A|nr:helix-turn-helix transcriptional regulator [Dysgonomonas sp. Marseille-P4677]MBK5721986.1 AraC family transcriptional regulator [Dysgonomonas sp. Marseille-P4677]
MAKIDSLNLEIEKANGEKKLELLFKLANLHLETDELFKIARRVEEEALKQKNIRYLAESKSLLSKCFMLQNNLDSTIYYGELANWIYSEHDIQNPNKTYFYIGRIYLFYGYYELAIHYIKLYLESKNAPYTFVDYGLLTEAYLATNNYDLAKKTVLQGIEQSKLDKAPIPFQKLILYYYLIVAYTNNKEYDKALETCATMDKLIARHENELQEPFISDLKILNYNNYASIYVCIKNASKVKFFLDKINQIPYNESLRSTYETVNCTWGEYYLLQKEYDKALHYLNSASKYFTEEQPQKYLDDRIIKLRITALEELGKFKEALFLQKEWTQYQDSINQINLPLQIAQLTKTYELEKIAIERDKDKARLEKSRAINIGLVAILILLFIILFLIKRSNKKIKDKNKNLFKQYIELDKYTSKEKRFFMEKQESPESDSKELQLFKKIETYINESEIFKNPNLTREDLSEQLNTNRSYLTDAIKAETGKTFLEYINHYRLDYARLQLIVNESAPVNQIMYEAGFASSSTFYKLFKERFGMSPNELRQTKSELDSNG